MKSSPRSPQLEKAYSTPTFRVQQRRPNAAKNKQTNKQKDTKKKKKKKKQSDIKWKGIYLGGGGGVGAEST